MHISWEWHERLYVGAALPALHLSSRLDLSSHLLLSICCYVIRWYVAPFCILHGTFCFIIHDNPHDAYTSVHYTHAHACIDGTACIRLLQYYSSAHAILPIAYLHSYVHLYVARMHTYIHTCKHRQAQARTCNTTFLRIEFAARMSRTLAYFFRCLRLLIYRAQVLF